MVFDELHRARGESSLWSRHRGSSAPEGDFSASAGVDTLIRQLGPNALSERDRAELRSIASETDRAMFGESLLAFASERVRQDRLPLATAVLTMLAGSDLGVESRARSALDAVEGRGAASGRAEFLMRRLAREATDPRMLVGMSVASAAFSLTRFAALARLSTSPGAVTRFIGANRAASLLAFGAEATLFPLATRLTASALGDDLNWDPRLLAREWASSVIVLGSLKLASTGANALGENLAARHPALRGSLALPALSESATLGGILLGHQLEEAVGLRQRIDGATTLADSLAMLLSFHVAGRFTRGLTGGRLEALQADLESRSRPIERLGSWGELMPNPWRLAAAHAAAENSGLKSESRIAAEMNRPMQMTMLSDGTSGTVRSPNLREFFAEVVSKGRLEELERAKNIVCDAYVRATGRKMHENFERYRQGQDPDEWGRLIGMIGSMLQGDAKALATFEADPALVEFRGDWISRPHFKSSGEIKSVFQPGLKAGGHFSKAAEDLRRALYRDPHLRSWREYAGRLRHPPKRGEAPRIFQMEERDRGDHGKVIAGNWLKWGLTIRFDARGHLLQPLQFHPPFADAAAISAHLQAIVAPSPASAAPAALLTSRSVSRDPEPAPTAPVVKENPADYAPKEDEDANDYALRLMYATPSTRDYSARIAALTDVLVHPGRRAFGKQTAERIVAMSSATEEGSGLVGRRYAVAGAGEPIIILSPPQTFLPEQWSHVFAEGLSGELRRSRQPVQRAVEIGSGTGFISILLSRLGAASEIIGLDRNPHAIGVGRLNALINGVTNVSFQESSLFSGLPRHSLADLVVACIPQVPSDVAITSDRELADRYPSEGGYWDRFGLGLINRMLQESRSFLSASGKILLNLAGRPGRETLERLWMSHGYHPRLTSAEMISQDPRTNYRELAEREDHFGHNFEFYLKDPTEPITARQAIGKSGVKHMLYVMEGRAYSGMLPNALSEIMAGDRPVRYTEDPGTEMLALRDSLGAETGRRWGVRFASTRPASGLFIAPGMKPLLESWLRAVMPENGQLLTVGDASARLMPILDINPAWQSRAVQHLDGTAAPLAAGGITAAVVELSHERYPAPPTIAAFLDAFPKDGFLLVIDNHPRLNGNGDHPWIAALRSRKDLLARAVFAESVDERMRTEEFPLAAALIPNPVMYRHLARLGDASYSRASLPLQAGYDRLLRGLSLSRHPTDAPTTDFPIENAALENASPLAARLELSPAFISAPLTTHLDPIDMSFGESEWTLPRNGAKARTEDFVRMPAAELEIQAKQAVQKYLEETRGVSYSPEQIVLGMGVQPLQLAAIRALSRGRPGFRVFLPRPSYGLSTAAIDVAGGTPVEVRTHSSRGFLVDPTDLKATRGFATRSGPNSAALLLNLPVNPSGRYHPAQDFHTLVSELRRNGDFLLFDDVFGQLRFNGRKQTPLNHWRVASSILKERMIGFGGISKEFAMGGVRFGFAVAHLPEMARAIARENIWRPDPLAMAVGRDTLGKHREAIPQHVNYLTHGMLTLTNFFRERTIPFTEVEGGYALFVDLSSLMNRRVNGPGRPAQIVDRHNFHEILMRETGIKIHSDEWAGIPYHYRFVFSINRIEEAVERLRKFIRSLR